MVKKYINYRRNIKKMLYLNLIGRLSFRIRSNREMNKLITVYAYKDDKLLYSATIRFHEDDTVKLVQFFEPIWNQVNNFNTLKLIHDKRYDIGEIFFGREYDNMSIIKLLLRC